MLGPVFRAYEPEQGRLVAVKLFQLDLLPERAHQLVTELEALLAADLAHPGIAAPVAAGLSGVSAYLAQDFVTADSLDTIARHGPSSVADVARVASQLAGALGTAAALGVLHGALHPRDVLISSDDARMTGIGVAQALERIGSPVPVRRPYSAPERMAGGAWDGRADVFSLAALVFELLTGRRIPGPGDVTIDMMGDVPGDRQAIRRVLSRGLAEEPADRFDTAMAFADALQEALGRKSRVAPARVASKPLPFDIGAAMEEPARFAPVPVEELPLLTDEMLVEKSVDEHSTADDRGAESEEGAPFPNPGSMAAVRELSLIASELPEDDLPLTAGDAQPALADLHLSEPGNDDFVLFREDAPEPPSRESPQPEPPAVAARTPDGARTPDTVTPDSDETTRPTSISPRERPTSLVVPPPRAVEPLPPEPVGIANVSAPDRMSGVRPLVLALVVGVAIGVPIGIFIAPERLTRRVPTTSAPLAAVVPTPIVEEPVREFIDRAAPRDALPASQASIAAPPPGGTEAAGAAPPSIGAPPPAGAAPPSIGAPPLRQPSAEPMPAATVSSPDRGTRQPRVSTAANPTAARTRVDRPDPRTERQVKTVREKVAAARVPAAARPAAKPAAPPSARTPARAPAPARAAAPAPAPAKNEPGSLLVDSRPPGANVFLDGRLVGATPLVLPSVPLGEHAIHLERAGYQRWASSVTIVSGEQSRVKASLENR